MSGVGTLARLAAIWPADGPGFTPMQPSAAKTVARKAHEAPAAGRIDGYEEVIARQYTGGDGSGKVTVSHALAAARLDVSTLLSHSVHMDVGVRRLKQHLSEYLEKAAGGAIIRITDRGRPKAVLGPVPGTLNLERGVAERWIRPGPAAATSPRPARRHAASSSSTKVLREDRDR